MLLPGLEHEPHRQHPERQGRRRQVAEPHPVLLGGDQALAPRPPRASRASSARSPAREPVMVGELREADPPDARRASRVSGEALGRAQPREGQQAAAGQLRRPGPAVGAASRRLLALVARGQHRGGAREDDAPSRSPRPPPSGPEGLVTTTTWARPSPASGSRSVPRGKTRALPHGARPLHHEDLEVLRDRAVLEAVVEHDHGGAVGAPPRRGPPRSGSRPPPPAMPGSRSASSSGSSPAARAPRAHRRGRPRPARRG